MTFGSLNEFIGSAKIDMDQPHIALTSRNVLAHFLAIKEEDQLASGSTKPVGNDNAITLTSTAVRLLDFFRGDTKTEASTNSGSCSFARNSAAD